MPVRFLEPLLEILQHEWKEFKQENPYNRRLRLERSAPGQEAGSENAGGCSDHPVYGLHYGKIHLATPKERFKALQRIGELVAQHPGQRIGLLSHQSFTFAVRQQFPQIQVGHYYGQRGSKRVCRL